VTFGTSQPSPGPVVFAHMETPTNGPRAPLIHASQRSRSGPSRNREVMELFNIYTRLAFGATMILAALCVVIEQVAGTL
jgi:hypothetical protein